MMLHADLALGRRLERTEACANADFVETRALRSPETGACWIDVRGTYAMFDGPASPCTQTFGLGMFEEAAERDLEALEHFFFERESEASHETCPLAHGSLLRLLGERDYRAIEQSNVLFRTLESGITAPEGVRVRVVGPGEYDLWARVCADGWSDESEYASQMLEIGQIVVRRQGNAAFLAEVEGVPAAAGALSVHDGVALLAGASTIPAARRRGAQLALLHARLEYARERGCDLAMIVTAPGSGSQRNAERHGFRVAYTRTKWMKARPA